MNKARLELMSNLTIFVHLGIIIDCKREFIAMQLIIIGYERANDDGKYISSDFRKLIIDQKIDEVAILNPAALDISGLASELAEIAGDSSITNYDLPPLSTDQLLIKDLKNQPWELMNSMLRVVKQPGNCLFVIGRGAAIHQHIMWLCAQISGSNILELSSPDLTIKPANLANKENFNPIGKKTLGAFPHLYIDEILNNNQDTKGWFGAIDLSQIDGALTSGLSAAMKPFVDNNYVLTEKAKDGNSIYKLTYSGWPQAINEYCSALETEQETMELLVGFGRLPEISDGKGPNARPIQFFSQIAPMQPFDTLIMTIQKHTNSYDGSIVMSLNDACEQLTETDFIGDLRAAKEILRQRCLGDGINHTDHIVCINPKNDEGYQESYIKLLLSMLKTSEQRFGLHNWNFDITNVLNEIKSTVSMIANASNSNTYYTLKSRGEMGVVKQDVPMSRYSRAVHKLTVPNRFAMDCMSLNEKPGNSNILVGLMLLQDSKKRRASLLPFDIVEEDEKSSFTWKELRHFVETVKTPYDLKKGIVTGTQTRMNPLVRKGLVIKKIPQDGSAKLQYGLTNEGYALALNSYLHKKRGGLE